MLAMDWEYIGDAVYMKSDGNSIILRTSSHEDDEYTNEIYLEPEVMESLLSLYEKLKGV